MAKLRKASEPSTILVNRNEVPLVRVLDDIAQYTGIFQSQVQ